MNITATRGMTKLQVIHEVLMKSRKVPYNGFLSYIKPDIDDDSEMNEKIL
jgi:hypothetical protein